MAGETTPSGSTSNTVQPSAPPSTEQVASQSIQNNTDRLGQVDVQGLVNSVKASSPDVQTQRDIAAAAAKQIDDRGVRREFVKALEDQGVARKPGFWERQWQGVKGTATGLYEGGASLVGGVYDLGKMGVQGTVATAKFGYSYATDAQYRANTNAAVGRTANATIDATKQGLTAAKDYAADRIADPSKLLVDAKTVDSAIRSGADAVAKKADQLYDSYDKARSEAVIQGTTDELGGKIIGRAAFEVGSLVMPVTKVGALGNVAEGVELAADAQKAVKVAEATNDAAKAVRVAETATDASKAATAVESVARSTAAADGGSALTSTADRALLRTGDDAGRVARVEREARATDTVGAFETKVRGGRVVLDGVETRTVDYVKRDRVEYSELRRAFNSTERSGFAKSLAADPDKVAQLKRAGLDDNDIARLAQGKIPEGYQVHHKLPLDDGGTNSFDNLVLIKNDPYHIGITNAQGDLVGGLSVGDAKKVDWPIPPGIVYPAN